MKESVHFVGSYYISMWISPLPSPSTYPHPPFCQ